MIYPSLSVEHGGGIHPCFQQLEPDDSPHLFIGLGGTGIDCLRAVKKQIFARFTPDDDSPVMDPVVIFDAQEKDEATGIERGEEAIPSDSYTVETGYVPYYNFADAATKVLYTLRSTPCAPPTMSMTSRETSSDRTAWPRTTLHPADSSANRSWTAASSTRLT